MLRRSTAWSTWRAADPCASARSPPSRSSAPTPTTCTGPWSDSSPSPGALAQHLHDGASQHRQVLLAHREGWSQVDDAVERSDEHAGLDEASSQGVEVADGLQFDHADRTHDTHVANARQAAAGHKAL